VNNLDVFLPALPDAFALGELPYWARQRGVTDATFAGWIGGQPIDDLTRTRSYSGLARAPQTDAVD
jgi:hypothetical protein